ncbi:MAG: hypothetical protein KKG76_04795 [Euryarchaeota archaeon]|nr:hypothetical protein [Euryarchaeota archaeon]
MTAEIVIMNKQAIALASDSAVTMTQEMGEKIKTSANKLFSLSKYRPVGIMVFGNADLMDVPWETIIKMYRTELGKKKFDTLKEYADNFIEEQIDKKVESIISEKNEITEYEVKQITSAIIKNHHENWKNAETIPSIPSSHFKEILDKYGEVISDAINDVFEKLPISKRNLSQLKEISGYLFSKFHIIPDGVSGVVIAGFGEKDTFPSLKVYVIEGILINKLKYKEFLSVNIGFETAASIIPFAQREMVDTFMQGVDPSYRSLEDSYLTQIFSEYTEMVVNNMKKYSDPVTSVVSMLPKDELAAMAEALVNLTSFKRKVSMETETVGGPIDVAVISKGDGFIWIKRKHYFKPELNPQFFANHYKEEIEDGEK